MRSHSATDTLGGGRTAAWLTWREHELQPRNTPSPPDLAAEDERSPDWKEMSCQAFAIGVGMLDRNNSD